MHFRIIEMIAIEMIATHCSMVKWNKFVFCRSSGTDPLRELTTFP